MRLTKRRGYELLTTGTAVSLPAAATGQSQSAIFTPVDIAQWTLDSQGNALVKLHDGSIQSLTFGTFKIVRGRLVPITRDDEPALDVPGNDQPVTTGDLEELGVFELSQLITTEVDVDGTQKVMGISTELLEQIGWYSAGAGGVAGIVVASTGFFGAGESGSQGPTGATGPTGAAGSDGADGVDGSDGDSAYQIWLSLGNSGTQQDFIDSLTGPTGADGNNHPSISGGSASYVTVSENSTAVFYDASASDPDGDSVTFSKGTTGGDENLFTVSSDGEISFTNPADYENPDSSGGGNTYLLRIVASDGRGGTDTQDVTVNVTDITENSTLELYETDGATFNILQGNTYLFDAFDSEGDTITYSLISNGHGSGVTLDGQTGLLSVASNVAAGSADVTIRASSTNPDQTSETDTETYTINVQDITPPTLTIAADDDTLTLNQSTTLNFNFSEDVTGFTSGDISLSGNGSLTNFSGSGDSYTATYTAAGSDETDTVSVAAGAFADEVGQNNTETSNKNLAVGGMVEDYGNYYSAFGAITTVEGTSSTDQLTFGGSTTYQGGFLTINGKGGDDTVTVSGAGGAGERIDILNNDGNQSYSIGGPSNGGVMNINVGNGNHSFSFGSSTAANSSILNINAGSGEQSYSFERLTASSGGQLNIINGDGNKTYNFNQRSHGDGGNITINSGEGNHSVNIGTYASSINNSNFSLIFGNGNHYIKSNVPIVSGGNFSIDVGDGSSVISLNGFSSSSQSNIKLGVGSHSITISGVTDSAEMSISSGAGGSNFVFSDGVARNSGSLTLDVGVDVDSDTIIFSGLVGNVLIQNYSVIYDDKVDIVVPSTWSGTDNGTDIVFTQSDQTITFEGLGGVGGSTDPLDYFM